MSGTVNISRDIWSDTAFKAEAFTEREAFMWLIMEASWKPRPKRVGDYVVNLQRTELAASVRFMGKAWGWKPAKVQRFIDRLKKLGKICVKTDTGVSVITVCKYEEYQNKPKEGDTGPIQDRYRTDTNENKGLIPDSKRKEEDTCVSSMPRPANDASEAVGIYNEAAVTVGWSTVQKLNPTRSKHLRARLNECGGIEGWRSAVQKALASDFICGRGDRCWNGFNFDSLIKSENFTKLMEGKYDNRPNNPRPAQRPQDRPDPALEQIARLAGIGGTPGNGGC